MMDIVPSRTQCIAIVAGVSLWGLVELGAIGGAIGGLVDSGRAVYRNYISNSQTSLQTSQRGYDGLAFTKAGAVGGGGLGALLFGACGGIGSYMARVVARIEAERRTAQISSSN